MLTFPKTKPWWLSQPQFFLFSIFFLFDIFKWTGSKNTMGIDGGRTVSKHQQTIPQHNWLLTAFVFISKRKGRSRGEKDNMYGWETTTLVFKLKKIMEEQNKAVLYISTPTLISHTNTYIFFKTPRIHFLNSQTLKTRSLLDSFYSKAPALPICVSVKNAELFRNCHIKQN